MPIMSARLCKLLRRSSIGMCCRIVRPLQPLRYASDLVGDLEMSSGTFAVLGGGATRRRSRTSRATWPVRLQHPASKAVGEYRRPCYMTMTAGDFTQPLGGNGRIYNGRIFGVVVLKMF